ncbi:MAG: hypothetical protein ACRD2E_03880, partial [Terriglobales bacterium]
MNTEHWERALAIRAAAESGAAPLEFHRSLSNADRSAGAALSGELLRRQPDFAAASDGTPRLSCAF